MQYDLFEQFQEQRRAARLGIALAPPPEELAPIVRFARAMRGWKQQTLAEFAGVSLATVERIERGVRVNPHNLDSVAMAPGYQKADFTAARVPASDEEMIAKLEEWERLFADNKVVPMRPLRTQSQMRALLKADAFWVDLSRLGDDVAELEAGLREALDCYSFVIKSEPWFRGTKPVRRREAYRLVLQLVRQVEVPSRATALAGTYETDTPAGTWTVALVWFFPKESDPAAIKGRGVMAPKYLDLPVPDWMRVPRSPSKTETSPAGTRAGP